MSTTPESVHQALHSADTGERLWAVNQCRYLSPDVAFAYLQQASADTNVRVRYAAVSQMATAGVQDRESAQAILRDRLSHDPELDVQAAAADALGALQCTDAFAELRSRYFDGADWILRLSIISALGVLGEPQAFEVLQQALEDPEPLVQTAAIGALGDLGNPAAVALIAPFATHEDWQVRYRVAHSLSQLGGTEAVAPLQQLSTDPIAQVAETAISGLKQG